MTLNVCQHADAEVGGGGASSRRSTLHRRAGLAVGLLILAGSLAPPSAHPTGAVALESTCDGGALDDGVACTLDFCDEQNDVIVHQPDDAFCDDHLFCSGVELCDPVAGCQPGFSPIEDDGIACTVELCDEEADTVVNVPDDSLCAAHQICDPEVGCVASCFAILGARCRTDQPGECARGGIACPQGDAGPPLCVPVVEPVPEVCFNALDDDCNGVVDDREICRVAYGELPAWAEDVEIDGQFAYVANQEAGLQVLLVGELLTPIPLERFDPGLCADGSEFFADDVELADGLIFVAAGPCGLYVLSFGEEGLRIRSVLDTQSWAEDVSVAAGIAYVGDHDGGLLAVDVSDPLRPSLLSRIGALGSSPDFGAVIDVEVDEDGLVYAAAANGLYIVDVSDPQAPAVLGRYPVRRDDATPQDVEIADFGEAGRLAFLASWLRGVEILDVTFPRDISRLARIPSTSASYEVDVVGDLAFIANGSARMQVFDVSEPSVPVQIDVARTRGFAWDVEVSEGVAYLAYGNLAAGTGGLQALDITPLGFAGLQLTRAGSALRVLNDVVLVAGSGSGGSGVAMVDVSRPEWPGALGTLPVEALDMEPVARWLAVAEGAAGVSLWDLSDPTAPARLGGNDRVARAQGLAQSPGILYVAAGSAGLRVLDLSQPAAPPELGALRLPGAALDVAVAGGVASVALGDGGLALVDVRDPAAPVLVGWQPTPSAAHRVVVARDVVHVLQVDGRVTRWDVSNPAAPAALGESPLRGVVDLALQGSLAFVATAEGVVVVDLLDPARPVELARVETVGSPRAVAIDGTWLYVADGSGQLRVVAIGPRLRRGWAMRCGLGWELALLAPLLVAGRRWRPRCVRPA